MDPMGHASASNYRRFTRVSARLNARLVGPSIKAITFAINSATITMDSAYRFEMFLKEGV